MEHVTFFRALDTVQASRASTREFLAASPWLDDRDLDDVAATEAELDASFEKYRASAVTRLGPPAYDDRTDREAVDRWFPEAIRLACWPHRQGLVYLALEQGDRETPIAISVGFVTQEEIDDLSAGPPDPLRPLSLRDHDW